MENEEFVMNMRDMMTVSRNIAQLYVYTAPLIARAASASYGGYDEAVKQWENTYRRKAIDGFTNLILVSCELKKVRQNLEKHDMEDPAELLIELWKADTSAMPTIKIVKKWIEYSRVLVDSGLINAFDMTESNFNNFRMS